MKSSPLERQSATPEVGVFNCEVHLKFRLLEEKGIFIDTQTASGREQLLEMLLDAFICGADEFLEPLHVHVEAREVADVEASPQMRRQLIRLRNSSDLA